MHTGVSFGPCKLSLETFLENLARKPSAQTFRENVSLESRQRIFTMVYRRTVLIRFILPVFVFCIFALAGCTAIQPVTPAKAPDHIALKVAVAPYFSYAPFYIAAAEGYFAEEG